MSRAESVTARVRKLVAAGKTNDEIRVALHGVTPVKSLNVLISDVRNGKRQTRGKGMWVPFSQQQFEKLRREAVKRGTSPPKLLRRVVDVVVGDGLLDAVIGD